MFNGEQLRKYKSTGYTHFQFSIYIYATVNAGDIRLSTMIQQYYQTIEEAGIGLVAL